MVRQDSSPTGRARIRRPKSRGRRKRRRSRPVGGSWWATSNPSRADRAARTIGQSIQVHARTTAGRQGLLVAEAGASLCWGRRLPQGRVVPWAPTPAMGAHGTTRPSNRRPPRAEGGRRRPARTCRGRPRTAPRTRHPPSPMVRPPWRRPKGRYRSGSSFGDDRRMRSGAPFRDDPRIGRGRRRLLSAPSPCATCRRSGGGYGVCWAGWVLPNRSLRTR